MKRRPFRRFLFGSLIALLAGCATAPTEVPPEARPEPLPSALLGFTRAEPETARAGAAWTLETGSFESAYGCSVDYEYYTPAAAGGDAGVGDEAEDSTSARAGAEPGLVVLAHGFLRDLASTRGWAKLWAGRGVRTVVVSFCNSSLFDGRHERNADDLVAAARLIAPGEVPILYAGFSAGGLSALLAADRDVRTVGYLGLDPVDSGDLAATVERLRMPALALYGAPSSCNAENNMIGSIPPGGRRIALRIPYSTHCDFEYPTDAGCARFCGSVEPSVEAEIRTTIRALATAWVEAQLGASPEAQQAFHARTLETLEASLRVEIVANE